jgi:hypothetical protein
MPNKETIEARVDRLTEAMWQIKVLSAEIKEVYIARKLKRKTVNEAVEEIIQLSDRITTICNKTVRRKPGDDVPVPEVAHPGLHDACG